VYLSARSLSPVHSAKAALSSPGNKAAGLIDEPSATLYNPAHLPELRGADIMVLPMEHDCLRPDSLPHLTRLYSDFLSWRTNKTPSAKLNGLYGHRPDLAGVKEAVRELARGPNAYPKEMRAAVVEILRKQNAQFTGGSLSAEVARNLDCHWPASRIIRRSRVHIL
jgi:hypothetical protein